MRNRLAILFMLLFCVLCPQTVMGGQDEKIPISVPEEQTYIVVDTLDGVEAKYREGVGNDITGEYSCAGFVSEYFMKVYGVRINNLIDTGPPQPASLLERVSVPQKGDLIFTPSPPSQNNHSAIVKSFDGTRITLIEQNYKWVTDGVTYVTVNRTIPYPSSDYEIWRFRNAPIEETPYDAVAPQVTATPIDYPELLELLAFQSNTDMTLEDGIRLVDSVLFDIAVLSDDKPYLFTVPDEFDLCIYAVETNSPDGISYRLAGPGETVTASDAVLRRPIRSATTATLPQEPRKAIVTVDSHSMEVNGSPVDIDAPAFLQSGRLMLPVKWVAGALQIDGQSILWDGNTRSVTVFAQGKHIQFTINSDLLYVDGFPVRMDCPAVLRNDRAYLPVKYLADALSVPYEWNGETRAVTFYLYRNSETFTSSVTRRRHMFPVFGVNDGNGTIAQKALRYRYRGAFSC